MLTFPREAEASTPAQETGMTMRRRLRERQRKGERKGMVMSKKAEQRKMRVTRRKTTSSLIISVTAVLTGFRF